MKEDKKLVKPDNFLVWAILSTALGCLFPIGIVAIVYANKFDSLWYAGRYAEAEAALKNAKMWTYISASAGVFGLFMTFGFILLVEILNS